MRSQVTLALITVLIQAVPISSLPVVTHETFEVEKPVYKERMSIGSASPTPLQDTPSQLLIGNDDPDNLATALNFGAESNLLANIDAHLDLSLAQATVGAEFQKGSQNPTLSDPAVPRILPGSPTWKRTVSGSKNPGGPPTWRRAPVEGKSKVESSSDEVRYRPKPGPPTWKRSEEDLERPTASGSKKYVAPGPPTWKA
ncbi:hypothetical protein PM082_024508 [Marasmius tenuissimus]|nr:hypothetical protein PM082_024508 [Marasmius tenuissimus]